MAYLAFALQAIKLKFIDGRFLTIFYFVRRSDQGSAGLDPAPHDKNDWLQTWLWSELLALYFFHTSKPHPPLAAATLVL
jgi:hypothetical protein